MNPILDSGIKIILFLQNLGGWLMAPMQFFSFLGNEEFFLIVMPIFLWCINMSVGLRLGFLSLIGGNLNAVFKLVFHAPRPYWIDPGVHAYVTETSFGIPSGHAQNSTSVWGGLAKSYKERWLWIVSILAVFFIGLSRLYNGVHFPTDVLAGWVIGALVLWIYIISEKKVISWLLSKSLNVQLFWALVFSLFFILLASLAKISLGAWTLPQLWVANASAAAPGSPPITPLSLSGIISDAGALFGVAAGAILLPSWGGYIVKGPAGKLALRFFVGLIGVLAIWRGLDLILPGGEDLLGFSLRYLRYAATGFWISGLAPVLFIRLHLSEKSSRQFF
jgi:membrane-associated phospholipid phosphatase